MEEVIKQAFAHLDVLGPYVLAGNYDLIGPGEEVILPSTWNFLIRPGWVISMQMTPMKEAPGGQQQQQQRQQQPQH